MPSADPRPRLYHELADWWTLVSDPADYAQEAEFYERILRDACDRPPVTLLELGSGGGNNASHLKARFEVTLTDASAEMLEMSRRLNPGCEHIRGDMRTLRLNRTFDCVFVHDAVCYMTTLDDLRRVVETALVHCRPGGAALFAPDQTTETFVPYARHGGRDGPERAARYLEWTRDPDPADTRYVVDYAYLLLDRDGRVRVEHDRHVLGLFARSAWIGLLDEVGFEPERIPFPHADRGSEGSDVFVGRRPAGAGERS